MSEIYAVSLTISQSSEAPNVTAHVIHVEDDRETRYHMQWDLPLLFEPKGDSGEWLYGVLSMLVQDFDDHKVTSASISGSRALLGGHDV